MNRDINEKDENITQYILIQIAMPFMDGLETATKLRDYQLMKTITQEIYIILICALNDYHI